MTVAALLALPLPAQAQKTTFVSNTGQSTDPDVREVGPHGHLWQLQAQQFRTGDNEGGYTLSAIQVRVDDFGSNSRPKVSIYTASAGGNPGTSLYVLTNPATLNDDAINTFRAPANATLEKDTDYFVVFEELGSGSNLRYDLEVTASNAEDSGTASGWNIADSSRQRSTTATTWSDLAGKLKIAVRGTLPPALSIADASAAENAGHLMFDVTLSRAFQNTVKVDFETISGGTATEGVDYHARRTYTHVILAGDKTAQMGFALIEDTVAAAGETVKVKLSNARVVDAYGNVISVLNITTDEATGTITAPPTTTTNVSGLTIGIQDATGSEDDGWLVFKVRLSRKYDDYVCYDFETISGGTAEEGRDYSKRPKVGQWVQIGKRVDKPFVRIIDDSVNDNGETVKVKISNARLCDDASQTVSITRAEATGTINNSDPIPQAWIARFGRTVAEQVLDAVESRMTAARAPGVEVSLAGQRIGGGPAAEVDEAREAGAGLKTLAEWVRGEGGEETATGLQSRTVTGLDFLTGSSFALTGGSREMGFTSLWGRGAISSFDGREGKLTLDGEVQSAMVGTDWVLDEATAGVMVSRSRGEGGYRSPGGSGEVESTLTGLYPYGHYAVSDRLSVWGVVGYGKGSLTLTPEGQAPMETDMDLTLAGAGLRSVMVAAPAEGGLELAANPDGFVVRTSSDRARGLAGANAEVTRVRLGLEGTWRGGPLVPSMEIGARHDGGDAETGFGMDIGAGLAWSDAASGIAAEVRGRGLLTHADGDFQESGFAGSLKWDPAPSSARGPTLTLSQTLGAQASGGLDSLFSRPTMAGLAANDDEDAPQSRRLDARLGYGFPLLGDRLIGTPELGLGLSDTGRDYSLGWRLAPARSQRAGFDLRLEGTRREAANDDRAPEHELRLRGALRW